VEQVERLELMVVNRDDRAPDLLLGGLGQHCELPALMVSLVAEVDAIATDSMLGHVHSTNSPHLRYVLNLPGGPHSRRPHFMNRCKDNRHAHCARCRRSRNGSMG